MKSVLSLTLALLLVLQSVPTAWAKTYIVTDGSRCLSYTAETGTPASGEGLQRPAELTLCWRGETSHHTSSGETVAQLLSRLGLTVTQLDVLSHPLETPVTDGMTLSVEHRLTRKEVYTTTIPHETTYCDDGAAPEGSREVLIPGQDGELLCSAEVTYINGREVNRVLLDQKQTIAPITEIVARGTARREPEESQQMPIIEDGYIRMPSGEILTYYKTDYVTATGYTHTDAGCDMITSTGTTVHYGTAAVDPRFIPYGTRMLIVSHDGERYYGIATAEDCGGAIKRDRMDLYFPTYQECIEFGRRRCTIYFLG